MAEYWKSTPKYICKYCDVYVRDTGLERTNHESTGRHQGAVKRFLRNLHRNAADEDREKERARREIDRLNGVPPSWASQSSSSTTAAHNAAGAATSTTSAVAAATTSQPQNVVQRGTYSQPAASTSVATAAERRAQIEQLAELGVSIPDEFRGDLALAGEWSTTSSKVIRRRINAAGEYITVGGDEAEDNDSRQKKKRVADADDDGREEERADEEAAMSGLFKKAKTARWGRDAKRGDGGGGQEADLDALLGAVAVATRRETGDGGNTGGSNIVGVKAEDGIKTEEHVKGEDVNAEDGIKTEDDAVIRTNIKIEDGVKIEDVVKVEHNDVVDQTAAAAAAVERAVKPEPSSHAQDEPQESLPCPESASSVLFKKRKPKNIRQR